LAIYFTVILEITLFYVLPAAAENGIHIPGWTEMIAGKLMRTPMYASPLNSKLFTLLLASLVTIGTLAKKEKDLHPKRQIALPLASGLLLFFGSLWLYGLPGGPAIGMLTASGAAYATSSLLGTRSPPPALH